MELWASGALGRQKVQFNCVCLDSRDVSIMFGRMFRFTHAKNHWISRRDQMPSYGQLGCSGFIVIDANGRCISRKTKAFLRAGPDAAFADVERLVWQALKQAGPSGGLAEASAVLNAYAPGSLVRLELPSTPELDGSAAVVVGFDTAKGRYIVELQGQPERRFGVLPCSLAPLAAPPPVRASAGIRRIECPPSVGNEDVDIEHYQCTKSLNDLLAAADTRRGAKPALVTAVLLCLEEHFEHEEEMAEEAGFGAASKGSGFSAFDSHKSDHNRILEIARTAEVNAKSCGFGSLADAQDIAFAFEKHASNFDTLLEGKLKSS